MDDGSKIKEGLHLNSCAFSPKEIDLLLNTLNIKFLLNYSIHKKQNMFRIYINDDSIESWKSLVISYIHKSMLYKINIKN
jgi:hypothetical protein